MQIAKLPSAEISFLDQPVPDEFAGESQNHPRDLPILLLHGFSSSIVDNWLDTNWVKFLGQMGLRVVAMDNRGHGNSEKFYSPNDYSLSIMARDAIDLLDHLNIKKAHIMGYSMGSRIASMLAMNHGDRVGRLILGGNGYGMVEGSVDLTPVRDGLLANSPDEIEDPRARGFRRFADRTGSDRQALAACIIEIHQLFSEQQFGKIINPVLIAIGEDDDIAGSGEKLAACMANASFFSIPNCDHMRATADKAFKNEVAVFLQRKGK